MFQIIKTRVSEIINQPRFSKNFFATYFTYLIGFLSILQANCLYKTDWTRASGLSAETSNWRHSGRIINDILSYLFNFSAEPQDISPLSQLLSIFFLTIASIILTQVICHRITYKALFVSVIIGLSPYYLQVFSYVFDSVYYTLAVLMAVVPFLFYRDNYLFYISSSVCLLWCLMSFQSTISIYMIVAAYLFYNDYQHKNTITQLLKKIFITVCLFLVIGVIYYLCIHLIFSSNDAAIFQSEVCKFSDCLNVFSKNFKTAIVGYFYRHWKNTLMGWAFLSVFISFIIFQIKQGWKNRRQVGKCINLMIALFTPFIMVFFIGLWTMFFTFIYWNARIWVGFGAFFAIIMLAMTTEENKYLKSAFYFFSVILIWGCIVFANRVGNLLDAQNKYVDFKIITLSQDLSAIPVQGIKFVPNVIHAPVVKLKSKEYPILKDLVSGIQHKWRRFTDYYFGFYRSDLHRCNSYQVDYRQVLIDNPHHKITQINNDCIEIEMK